MGEQLVTVENVTAFVLSEAVGLPFCESGAELVMHGEIIRGGAAFAIGLPLCVLGLTFPFLKKSGWLPGITSTLIRAASDYRIVVSSLFIVFVWIAWPVIVRRYLPSPTAPSTSSSTVASLKQRIAQLEDYKKTHPEDQCGASSIEGREDHFWTVEINLKTGQFDGYADNGETRHVHVHVYCYQSSVSMKQFGSTDANNCNYILDRNGNSLTGTYTCGNVQGIHEFSGKLQP